MTNSNFNLVRLPREKVFRDPVHNYIHVQYQVILDLIDTHEFQRLRRIKQLGTTSYTFHGAEHSRFEHCLGVYEITRKICDKFERNFKSQEPGDGLWDDSERIVALCAALLHDVGHGPYSHTFERLFNTNHEAITQQIITDKSTEINKVLRTVAPDFPEKVASVIGKTYPNPQVVQMISSQADADRMDYLLRDAYFTGTQYGSFDLTRILRVIHPYAGGIAFERGGMHAVEDYIVSRFQMYQQIYFHPVSRSMEVILDHLLKRAQDIYNDGTLQVVDQLAPFLEHKWKLADYLSLDDGVLNTNFGIWSKHKDPILSDLASRFLDRRPFKSVEFNDESASLLPKMRKLIGQAGFDPEFYTAVNDSFDLPYDSYDPHAENPKTQIEIMQNDGTLVELSEFSPLVRSIMGEQTGDTRFFFPKTMLLRQDQTQIFEPIYQEFQSHIKNNQLIAKTER